MSLGSSLSLSPDVATAVDTNAVTFAQRFSDSQKGEYSVAGLTLPASKLIRVSHETTKDGTERHLVRYDQVLVDSELVPATASVYFNVVRPPNTAITDAVLIAMVNTLVDFLADDANGNVTKLLNSET